MVGVFGYFDEVCLGVDPGKYHADFLECIFIFVIEFVSVAVAFVD